MEGWASVKKAATYADVSQKTIRKWFKYEGLKHSRLNSGRIRTRYQWIDDFLESLTVSKDRQSEVKKMVDEICSDFTRRKSAPAKFKHSRRR